MEVVKLGWWSCREAKARPPPPRKEPSCTHHLIITPPRNTTSSNPQPPFRLAGAVLSIPSADCAPFSPCNDQPWSRLSPVSKTITAICRPSSSSTLARHGFGGHHTHARSRKILACLLWVSIQDFSKPAEPRKLCNVHKRNSAVDRELCRLLRKPTLSTESESSMYPFSIRRTNPNEVNFHHKTPPT